MHNSSFTVVHFSISVTYCHSCIWFEYRLTTKQIVTRSKKAISYCTRTTWKNVHFTLRATQETFIETRANYNEQHDETGN